MTDSKQPAALDRVQHLLFDGDVRRAIAALKKLERQSLQDHFLLQKVAEMYINCGQHEQAGRCYARSVQLQPSNPAYLYNLAASHIALGKMDEAEKLFTEVIRLKPGDLGAWLNRSSLKKQTGQSNHIEQLKYVKSHLSSDDPGNIPCCYALAKELEDLQRYDESFAFLQEGSAQRHRQLQYDVSEDVRAMEQIAGCFSQEFLDTERPTYDSNRPIFILGLPRSGTTLVDRIISSHSQVSSLSEHNTLSFALMRESVGVKGKSALIDHSTRLDFAALGEHYCKGIDGFGKPAARLIDKTPLNFLYLGLLHLALPGARIIHLRRKPLDSCFAMYKTLFGTGYPFTYSLQDVGRYYIAYRLLMDHWRKVIPGAFLDVDYESMVADQEGETRRILDYCDLQWEDACLEFHRNQEPAATASAAQVRQPVYSSSVGLWRNYSRQLAPFAGKLREFGIVID